MGDGRPGSRKRNRARRSLRDLWRWNVRLWLLVTLSTFAVCLLAGFLMNELLGAILLGCVSAAVFAAVLLLPLWLQGAGDDTRQLPNSDGKANKRARKKQ